MRILFINSERGVAGGLTSAADLARGLAGAGHEIVVACHPASELRRRMEAIGIPVAPVAIRAEINVWRAFQIARQLGRQRPDVVLADKRKDVKLAFAALRLRPGAALVHRHGSPSPIRDSALYRAIWTRLQGLVVNSETMRRNQIERTPWISAIPIDVIHNGKDMTVWRPRPSDRAAVRAELGIPADAFVVAFHGVLQNRKNIDLLLHACAAMADRPHALIIGDGAERTRLETLAASLGVASTFTGEQTGLARLLSAADVGAHLSRAEGFSNSVIEALACGLPVIASNATSHVEQIEDGVTGLVVPPHDVAGLSAALETFAREPALRERMGRAARTSAVDRFGLDQMVERYGRALGRAATKKP